MHPIYARPELGGGGVLGGSVFSGSVLVVVSLGVIC